MGYIFKELLLNLRGKAYFFQPYIIISALNAKLHAKNVSMHVPLVVYYKDVCSKPNQQKTN